MKSRDELIYENQKLRAKVKRRDKAINDLLCIIGKIKTKTANKTTGQGLSVIKARFSQIKMLCLVPEDILRMVSEKHNG